MADSWACLPAEVLLKVFEGLPTKSLLSLSAVCHHWRAVSRDDCLWREVFFHEFHSFVQTAPICAVLVDEYGMMKRGCPTSLVEVVDDFGYELKDVVFSPLGTFYAVCGEEATFCVYETSRRELVEERSMAEKLGWASVERAAFSADETTLAVLGERQNHQREIATFSINQNRSLHFVSRLPTSSAHLAWLDSEWILSSETRHMDTRSRIAESLTQLFLYRRHHSAREAVLEPESYPLVRLLNEKHEPDVFLISSYVSNRFRRIVHLSKEANQEGKSLREKLDELSMDERGVRGEEEDDEEMEMARLRKMLDAEAVCFHCYFSQECHHDECRCICHEEQLAHLLIYSEINAEQDLTSPEDVFPSSKICIHIVFLQRVKQSEPAQPVDELAPGEDIFSYLTRHTTRPDHQISIPGELRNIALSPDHQILYALVKGAEEASPSEMTIRSFDLTRMLPERIVYAGGVASTSILSHSLMSATNYFLFCCSGAEVAVWSRVHGGPVLWRLQHPSPVRAVAAHPHSKCFLAAAGDSLYVWTPAVAEST